MTFNVDECLAEIWLQTVRLRRGEQFAPGEGRRLWQTCADNVTRVREVMRTAGLTEENMLHITYACCALLDEAVKSREVQDDASLVWYQSPSRRTTSTPSTPEKRCMNGCVVFCASRHRNQRCLPVSIGY